ncbi:MAG TPA: cyclic nucleotide-binding domain-containing protein [Candidatus Dormibacteraeota bacterium]
MALPAYRVVGKVESKPRRRRLRFLDPEPAELIRRLDVLERAPIFFTLPEGELRSLTRRMRSLTAEAGDVLIEQGRASAALFFVASGSCQLRSEPMPGHSVALSILRAGDFFGEAALFTDQPSPVSVVAREHTQLLVIDRPDTIAAFRLNTEMYGELHKLYRQRQVLHHDMATQANWGQLADSGEVIAVYSPKGGAGTSTLALNLAAAIAQRHPREVLLLDLAFPYNAAALLSNLVPTGSLAAAGGVADEDFEDALLSASLYHPAGLMVLPGGIRPEDADTVSADMVGRALDVLRRTFSFVVVDLAVQLSDVALTTFEQAQQVVMVTTPEITAAKGITDAIGILGALGVPGDRIAVIVNHRNPRSAISLRALEHRLGRSVQLEVRHDGDRPDRAALAGALLVATDPKSELSRGALSLAENLDGRARQRPHHVAMAAVSAGEES